MNRRAEKIKKIRGELRSLKKQHAAEGTEVQPALEETMSRITTSQQPESKSKVASRFLKERFRSHQKSLALIGCCKIIYRAISVVICIAWMRMLAPGMKVRVRSMPTGSFGRRGLMLQDLKPTMNPKETSLRTHPDASMKM